MRAWVEATVAWLDASAGLRRLSLATFPPWLAVSSFGYWAEVSGQVLRDPWSVGFAVVVGVMFFGPFLWAPIVVGYATRGVDWARARRARRAHAERVVELRRVYALGRLAAPTFQAATASLTSIAEGRHPSWRRLLAARAVASATLAAAVLWSAGAALCVVAAFDRAPQDPSGIWDQAAMYWALAPLAALCAAVAWTGVPLAWRRLETARSNWRDAAARSEAEWEALFHATARGEHVPARGAPELVLRN